MRKFDIEPLEVEFSGMIMLIGLTLILISLHYLRTPIFDGSVNCSGSAFRFRPGSGVPQGVGDVDPVTRDRLNAACQAAARSILIRAGLFAIPGTLALALPPFIIMRAIWKSIRTNS